MTKKKLKHNLVNTGFMWKRYGSHQEKLIDKFDIIDVCIRKN